MKTIKNWILYLLITILQFSVIIAAIVLEDLSSKKMGVARYLVYKKQTVESTLLTPFLINIYTIIFVVGAVVCLFLMLTKGKNKKLVISLLGAAAANIIGIIFIQSKLDLQAYPFFILGIFIVIVVQYGWIMKVFSSSKKE